MKIFEKLISIIKQNNIPYEIISHSEIKNTQEGLRILKCLPSQVVKTLCFKNKNAYVFFAIRGDKRLDFSKVKKVCGITRKNLTFATTEEIENALHYEAGGLSPLHIDENIKVIFDKSIPENKIVYCGIGLRNKTLKISSKDLCELSNCTLCDISE